MEFEDAPRSEPTTGQRNDRADESGPVERGDSDCTLRPGLERFRAAADERYEAAAALSRDTEELRDELGELASEPAALIEELEKVRQELERGKARFAPGAAAADEPERSELPGREPDPDPQLPSDHPDPGSQAPSEDPGPALKRRGPFRSRHRH